MIKSNSKIDFWAYNCEKYRLIRYAFRLFKLN